MDLLSWETFLKEESEKEYYKVLMKKLDEFDENWDGRIFPPRHQWLRVFSEIPYETVRVVIIAQDPYPTFGNANGLAFSVNSGVKPPPSLVNIFKEIESDLGIKCHKEDGDLTRWANQGVFLLNSTLTVQEGIPNSHEKLGWSNLTDNALKLLDQRKDPMVFMLFGNFAKKKSKLIKGTHHLILQTSHPSPLGVRYGFSGSKIFSKTNAFLERYGMRPIDWR